MLLLKKFTLEGAFRLRLLTTFFKKVLNFLISIKILTSSTELILQTDDDMSENIGTWRVFYRVLT